MEQVLLARQALVRFCKRYDIFIVFVLKFVFGVFVFSMINDIDRSLTVLSKVSSMTVGTPYTMLMALIFAVAPINAGYLLITFNLCLQTSAVLPVALVLGVFLLAVQGLYTRLAPEECVLILFMLIAYYFKLPYLVPILAGLYFSLTSMIPLAIAAFMWQFLPTMLGMFRSGADTELTVNGLTEAYQASYTQIVSAVAGSHDWIAVSFIFAMVVLVVYAISHTSIDYSKDIAIGLGGMMTIIGFVIINLFTDVRVGLGGVFLSTLASVALAYAVRFFDALLDYDKVERVQFEDEDNVYYVKIVPKIILGSAEAAGGSELVRIAAPAADEDDGDTRPGRRADWAERWEQIERERGETAEKGR